MRLRVARIRRAFPLLPICLSAFLAGAQDAIAQDLESGVDEAGVRFRRIIKSGAAVAAAVITVIGLMISGFRFSQKDHSAIWYLAGTAAAGALFGVAAAML